MVITSEVIFPEPEELKIDEVNMSTATLMAASNYIGKQCEAANNEFMLCRQERNDARPCLKLGKHVTLCAKEVLRRIKCECLEEFKQYANCVDKSSGNFSFRHCRKTQKVFDNCMKENLCVLRPDFGYFCRGRVHISKMPPIQGPPCPCPLIPEDTTPGLPDCKPRLPPRFAGRLYWSPE